MKLRFAIDRCEQQDNLILLQGWILPCDGALPELSLQGHAPDGTPWHVELPVDIERSDVRARHPEVGDRDSGFFFYGRLPLGELQALVARQSDTAPIVLVDLSLPPLSGPGRINLHALLALARQALALARNGKWRLLREKTLRRIEAARAPSVHLDMAMKTRLHNLKIDALVIDHDLGGGANLYRQRWIKERLAQGECVGLIVYSILRLGYVFSFHSGVNAQPEGVFAGHDLAALLETLDAPLILYNNSVSHPEALAWPRLLANQKRRSSNCRLVVALHDFFPVCPSPHLLDADNRFCGVPQALDRCAACLVRSRQPFVDLYRHHGITAWRASWGELLACADEVLTFSPSGGQLLLRAYPQLDATRISLRPHKVEPLTTSEASRVFAWQSRRQASGVIAVVGSITSVAKGAHVIHDLAQWLHEQQSPWKLRVIGSCSPTVRLTKTIYGETGPYAAENLTDHVLALNPDVFLFPSTAPETFSFVLHEIARYGRPIAAYPIGAQGDFLEHYSRPVRLPTDAQDDPAALVAALAPHLSYWLKTP